MNDTITLPRLAELMATQQSGQYDEVEKFIKAFFMHLEDSLVVSDEVTIDGLGIFSRTSDPDSPIAFQPAPTIAEALNQPFEMFEPIAVGDADISSDIAIEIEDKKIEPEIATTLPPPVPEMTKALDNPQTLNESKDHPVSTPPIASPIIVSEHTDPAPVGESNRPRVGLWVALAFIVGLLIGAVISFFSYENIIALLSPDEIDPESELTVNESQEIFDEPQQIDELTIIEDFITDSIIESGDTSKAIITNVKEEPVEIYDTVTPERFLTTMARQYYGQMEYWVFIYEANSNVLGNPNRIKPGTRVIIPDKNKFAGGETPEETLARAKRMSKEIYERY